MLSHQEILSTVQGAFHPLHCNAEIWDYDAKLKFQISDSRVGVIRGDEVALHLAQDKELLQMVVKRVKERIASKGYMLANFGAVLPQSR